MKAANYRSFYPNLEQRLRLRIPIPPEFTAIASGHGKTIEYLNRFQTIDDMMYPCNEGEQTVEHLIYVCSILEPRRNTIIKHITTRGGIWAPANSELIDKLYICIPTNCTQLIYFINNTLKHMYCLKL